MLNENEISSVVESLKLPEISNFRLFVLNMWEDHKEEVFTWTKAPVNYTSEEYFNNNKWYLKTLYKKRSSN